jgi:hypothetical protein
VAVCANNFVTLITWGEKCSATFSSSLTIEIQLH